MEQEPKAALIVLQAALWQRVCLPAHLHLMDLIGVCLQNADECTNKGLEWNRFRPPRWVFLPHCFFPLLLFFKYFKRSEFVQSHSHSPLLKPCAP